MMNFFVIMRTRLAPIKCVLSQFCQSKHCNLKRLNEPSKKQARDLLQPNEDLMNSTTNDQPTLDTKSDTNPLEVKSTAHPNDSALDAVSQQAIYDKLAQNLALQPKQVAAFARLYDEGATVPFIARYRKAQTQGLDDVQLRALEKQLNFERDMAARRQKILTLLASQGKLNDDLRARIAAATSKLALEDIYLPYRPRRRSLASQAKAAGLQPIAETILQEAISPTDALANYQPPTPSAPVTDDTNAQAANTDITANDTPDFSDDARQRQGIEAIILDEWMQDLDLLDRLRVEFGNIAFIHSQLASEDKREVGEKYKDYFDHSESLAKLPNHRLLAMLRGRQDNVLGLTVKGAANADDEAAIDQRFIHEICTHFGIDNAEPSERREFLTHVAKKLWQDKWRPHIEHRLLTEKRLSAEADAINVFANNLHHLLMAAPAGQRVILGVDPGIRHGVKMAVVDSLGHVAKADDGSFAVATVYPFAPDNKVDEAKTTIAQLLKDHHVDLIAIGNGTASRETDALIKTILAENPELTAVPVVVNESGASVYSASELASQELGELDVSIRGAVSIARRLQDPLSELVKVEPKAIGVGQYQHDVNQNQLADSLDKVTQDCVNAVGVDVNTASPAILAHIAGLNRNVAQQIVSYRNEHGAFANREQLKNVPRLGAKTFEQAAGFLRIRGGDEPLDATGLHPENYALVKDWLTQSNTTLAEVLGDSAALDRLDTNLLAANDADAPIDTASIKHELAKPAHDPRPEFKTAQFRDDVNSLDDLAIGMTLQGVVTNVTSFGCFIDVGVHQDGLVHISEMGNHFISDPLSVVKPGDIVSVRVISLDTARKRIGFSMKDAQSKADAKDNIKPNRRTPDTDANNEQPRANRKPRQARENRSQGKNHKPTNRPNRAKPERDDNQKIGTLGALLAQAGLRKSE